MENAICWGQGGSAGGGSQLLFVSRRAVDDACLVETEHPPTITPGTSATVESGLRDLSTLAAAGGGCLAPHPIVVGIIFSVCSWK